MVKATLKILSVTEDYYHADETPRFIDLPELNYLSIDGRGEPGGAEFQKHIQALFTVAYQMKSDIKKERHDFKVPKLEAIWSIPKESSLGMAPKGDWRWTVTSSPP